MIELLKEIAKSDLRGHSKIKRAVIESNEWKSRKLKRLIDTDYVEIYLDDAVECVRTKNISDECVKFLAKESHNGVVKFLRDKFGVPFSGDVVNMSLYVSYTLGIKSMQEMADEMNVTRQAISRRIDRFRDKIAERALSVNRIPIVEEMKAAGLGFVIALDTKTK